MRGSLARHLVLAIGLPVTILFVLAAWFGAARSFQRVVADTESHARLMARYQAERIEESMNGWKQIPLMMALTIEEERFQSEAELEQWLKSVVDHNSDIHGACIAFEPEAFTPGKKYYAPYWHWVNGKLEFVQVGNETYDHFKWDWYRLPQQQGPMWTEPFYDEGGGDVMMTTRCVPFRREGKFRGVATVDIALTELVREAKKAPIPSGGYVMMTSRGGRFLFGPDEAKARTSTLLEVAPELGRRMIAGEDGLLRMPEPFGSRPSFVAYAPILRGAFSMAVVIPESEAMAGATSLVTELIIIGVIGLLGMLAGLSLVARSTVRPISQLARAARSVASGQLNVQVETCRQSDEVRDLTTAFSRMTEDLRRQMEELRHATADKERFAGELDAARTIQMGLVPRKVPAFPDRSDIDVHGIVLPAKEVGGDLCNYFFIDERHLAVIIGDVAGKGVPAALFMAVTTTLLKAYSAPDRSPGEVLALANRELYEEASAGVFVSLLYAIFDTETGEFAYASAGHYAPLVLQENGTIRELKNASAPACGILRDVHFPTESTALAPGESVILFTDGITEAMNARHDQFSLERLRDTIPGGEHGSADAIIGRILQSVESFTGKEVEQHDDITVVVLRWLATSRSPHVSTAEHPSSRLTAVH